MRTVGTGAIRYAALNLAIGRIKNALVVWITTHLTPKAWADVGVAGAGQAALKVTHSTRAAIRARDISSMHALPGGEHIGPVVGVVHC